MASRMRMRLLRVLGDGPMHRRCLRRGRYKFRGRRLASALVREQQHLLHKITVSSRDELSKSNQMLWYQQTVSERFDK